MVCGADHFSECVESHAFETYDKFIKAQGGIFKYSSVGNLHLVAVACAVDDLKIWNKPVL